MTENNKVGDSPVAIVTGAAGGIGAAIVRRFGQAGVRVVGTGRSAGKLEDFAKEIGSSMEFTTIATDITAEDAPRKIVDHAISTFGRLDYLVNNAGAGTWAPVHQTTDEMLDEVLGTSLRAPFRLCREALAHMKAGSSIVNIGSTFGIRGGLDGGAYCAAKAGLIGLTQAIAVQYGTDGIRCNLIAPGVIRTPMVDAYWETPYFQRLNHEMTPFNREGTPEDIANMVNFLCSSEGSYVHGQTIAMDGGWSTTKFLSREALLAERVG